MCRGVRHRTEQPAVSVQDMGASGGGQGGSRAAGMCRRAHAAYDFVASSRPSACSDWLEGGFGVVTACNNMHALSGCTCRV